MATIRIDKKTRDAIEKQAQETCKQLAIEARELLFNHYHSLIDMFYDDKPEGEYKRTHNLYNSASKYYKNNHDSVFTGGVTIAPNNKMNDYYSEYSDEIFPAERMIDKFIYVDTLPSATWHGGDWYGGYGIKANFSIYNEMQNYRDSLIKEFANRCKI